MKSLLVSIFVAALLIGCNKNDEGTKNASDAGKGGKLGRIDDGQRCDATGRKETLVDLNQDDVPDVRKVYIENNGEQVLVCREVDLDFDGVKDIFYFYDENGQITRDEANLDYTGTTEIVSIYAQGQVIKQELDTNSDGLVDKLRYLENGVPVRVEGDRDGDQRIDYWEYYEAGKLVRVGSDEDGDGKAETWDRDDATEAALRLDDEEEETEEGEEGEEGGEEAAEEDKPAEDEG